MIKHSLTNRYTIRSGDRIVIWASFGEFRIIELGSDWRCGYKTH